MKQINFDAKEALFNKKTRVLSRNTRTVHNAELNRTALVLHNTAIAQIDWNRYVLTIKTGGWHTVTTKSRLNALPNVEIYQKNYVWYLNGTEWNGEPIDIEL